MEFVASRHHIICTVCIGYCCNDVGISACAGGAALQPGSTMNGKWRCIILLSQHLRCQVAVLNSTAPDRLSYGTD